MPKEKPISELESHEVFLLALEKVERSVKVGFDPELVLKMERKYIQDLVEYHNLRLWEAERADNALNLYCKRTYEIEDHAS